MRTFVACLLFLFVTTADAAEPGPWRSLFNGKDLAGWDTYLGPPPTSVELPLKKGVKGNYIEPIGTNKDPLGVYSVVTEDGAPAIRISGQVFGAITTHDEFENYHLTLEMKWGRKKWPPRENAVRDSGLLYHCIGPQASGSTYWMTSFECQIQEGDTGDFWSVGGVIADVEGERADDKSQLVFRKGAPLVPGYHRRIIRNPRSEKPSGEWNTVEVYCLGQTAVHVSDGKTNMILTGLRNAVDGKEAPLTKGKLQIQSEGAEVFYRNIQIRPIDRIPDAILLK
ncbi:MAG: DUF1080 domain-containing protein [Pirellulales bacterium]